MGDDGLAVRRRELETAIAVIRELCEPVNPPKIARDYVNYFGAGNPGNAEMAKKHEPRRRRFYDAAWTLTSPHRLGHRRRNGRRGVPASGGRQHREGSALLRERAARTSPTHPVSRKGWGGIIEEWKQTVRHPTTPAPRRRPEPSGSGDPGARIHRDRPHRQIPGGFRSGGGAARQRHGDLYDGDGSTDTERVVGCWP